MIVALMASLGVTAGGVADAAGQADPIPLQGTRWVADAVIRDGKVLATQAGAPEAYVEFQAPDRITGSDGCNLLIGEAVPDQDTITFGLLGSTKRLCPTVSPLEGALHEVLGGTVPFTITPGGLYLSHPDGTVLVLRADLRLSSE